MKSVLFFFCAQGMKCDEVNLDKIHVPLLISIIKCAQITKRRRTVNTHTQIIEELEKRDIMQKQLQLNIRYKGILIFCIFGVSTLKRGFMNI